MYMYCMHTVCVRILTSCENLCIVWKKCSVRTGTLFCLLMKEWWHIPTHTTSETLRNAFKTHLEHSPQCLMTCMSAGLPKISLLEAHQTLPHRANMWSKVFKMLYSGEQRESPRLKICVMKQTRDYQITIRKQQLYCFSFQRAIARHSFLIFQISRAPFVLSTSGSGWWKSERCFQGKIEKTQKMIEKIEFSIFSSVRWLVETRNSRTVDCA